MKVAVVELGREPDSPRGEIGGWRLFPQRLPLSVPLPGACAMWSDTREHKKKESSYPYSSIKNGRV
jgi:hypothetical protein